MYLTLYEYYITGINTIRQVPNNWNWSCNFELADESADWCGESEATDDNFDWSIYYRPTPSDPSHPTGPDQAFRGNWYIYIETSNPRQSNDTAKLLQTACIK